MNLLDKTEELLTINKFFHFGLPITNSCNLHCEHCNSLCNYPFSINSQYKLKRYKWEISLNNLHIILRAFRGIGMNGYVRLTGGEPTFIEIEKLEAIINTIKSYERKIAIATNGYNLMNINKHVLNNISHIILNDHGINNKHISNCINYLDTYFEGTYEIYNTQYHVDIRKAKEHRFNKNKRCPLWMSTITIFKEVVYPCCNMFIIDALDKDSKIEECFLKNKWTVHNPNLIKLIKNWGKTIPSYADDQCLNHCWQPNINVTVPIKITLKKNDVINNEIITWI